MANYGLKYQCTFDNLRNNDPYKLLILEKNYSGTAGNVIGGANPVIHSWQTDEPLVPIKGSSLSIALINEGSLPLDSFYSVDDDQFKVQLFWKSQLIFEGFLVQDDCTEPLLDYAHPIRLSATDNLGLLKDIDFDKAPAAFELFSTENLLIDSAANIIGTPTGFGSTVLVGDRLEITGTIHDGTYTVSRIVLAGGRYFLTVVEYIGDLPTNTLATIKIYRNNPLLDKITLLKVLKRCISATNLELNTEIYCNVWETLQNISSSTFAQTLIDPSTFLKNDTEYKNCYSVLEDSMNIYGCTLFQAEGKWIVIKWTDIKYYGFAVPGFAYDKNFTLIGDVKLNRESVLFAGFNKFKAGIGEDTVAETGLERKIFRPFIYAKQKFDYKQPSNLLRNSNLQSLGNLLREYTSGTGIDHRTIREYAAPWFYYTNAFPTSSGSLGPAEYFIRVIKDDFQNETDRLLIVRRNDIHGYRIEASKDDKLKLSFQFKMSQISPGPGEKVFFVKLTNGTTTKYIKGTSDSEITTWENTIGYAYKILANDSFKDNWHTINIDSAPIPFDGQITVYFRSHFASPNEALYKDIRFEYTALINQSTKIIGHEHKNEQTATIKQKDDTPINIDDSPRNFISGTLFLDSLNGIIQKRTSQWKRGSKTETKKLGEITTYETLFHRRLPRTILEGSFAGLISPDTLGAHVSIISLFNYTLFPGLNFIPGRLEINYRNDFFTASLWEIFKDGEVDTDLTSDYLFKYIYDIK